ncbi:MAG: transposase [Methylococcaceae bacterium]
MLKKGIHTPAHLFIDNAAYFITSSIYQKRKLLALDRVKEPLIKTITACLNEKQWQLHHWVILDNHYHLLVHSHNATDMTKTMRKIHVLSAQLIHL